MTPRRSFLGALAGLAGLAPFMSRFVTRPEIIPPEKVCRIAFGHAYLSWYDGMGPEQRILLPEGSHVYVSVDGGDFASVRPLTQNSIKA